MSRSKAKILINLKPPWLRLASEVLQHACCYGGLLRPKDVSLLFSPWGHSQGESLNPAQHHTSTFPYPLAPRALPCFRATTGALTPAGGALRVPTADNEHPPCPRQVSLVHTAQPSMHSVTRHLTRPVIAYELPAQRDRLPEFRSDGYALAVSRSGLRHLSAGSSLRAAESCSSSYGLHVRLRLLSTPPHGDAVTFDYRERASPGGDLRPLIAPASGRTDPGFRRDD
jgi:hypothetical protein